MTVRAKFCCMEMTQICGFSGARYKFTPRYDQDIPEDRRFAKASPCGELWINVDNPAVSFEIGTFYYLDFTPVPAGSE